MASQTEDDWLADMLAAPALNITEFEDSTAILTAYFDASCRGQTFTYREAAGVSTADVPVFTVKAGPADVCRVTLAAAGDAGFGFHYWTVGRCEAYVSASSLATASVRIEAPADETVYLNGVAVGGSYITDANLPCADLTALESRYSDVPHRVRYEINGLYGDITVTDAQGAEVRPQAKEADDGAVLYEIGETGPYSFTVTAPSDAVVSVCGTALTDAELSSRGAGILAGLEKYTGGGDGAMAVYSASGLYREPVVTASDPSGRVLEENTDENGAITFSYAGDEQLAAEYRPTAEKFFSAYMDYGAGNGGVYDRLLSCILPGTDLYTYVADSTAAMYWASATQITYDSLDYARFVAWGEDCFTCRVSYQASLSAQAWYETNNYDLANTYDLAFVRQDGQWYAAAMSIVTE